MWVNFLFFIFALIVLFFILVVGPMFMRSGLRHIEFTPSEKDDENILLPYPPEWNVRQPGTDCGPYCAAAIVRFVTGKNIDSAEVEKNTENYSGYAMPQALVRVLQKYHIQTEGIIATHLSDDEKIKWLVQRLHAGLPVILLGTKQTFRHYIVLFGYHDELFSVYDPLHVQGQNGLTMDGNAEEPGNRDLTRKELLKFWGGGYSWSFLKYVAITAKT